MLKRIVMLIAVAALGIPAACAPAGAPAGNGGDEIGTPVPEPIVVPATETPATATAPAATETPAAGGELPMGEVPAELFERVLADVLERAGADRAAVEVLKSEFVVWSDGSLGCPQPGMMYTQALVDGYHVILSVNGTPYDYRLTDRGSFVLCESGPGIIIPGEETPTE